MRHFRFSPILIVFLLAGALLSCQLSYLQTTSTPTSSATATEVAAAITSTRTLLPTAPLPTIPVVSPTQPPAPVSVTAKDNLRVRAAPSTSAAVVDRLNKGASVQAVGRTATTDWLQIILPSNPVGRGWISADFVTSTGPLGTLPVVQPSAPIPSVPPSSGQPPRPATPPSLGQPPRPPTPPPYPYP